MMDDVKEGGRETGDGFMQEESSGVQTSQGAAC